MRSTVPSKIDGSWFRPDGCEQPRQPDRYRLMPMATASVMPAFSQRIRVRQAHPGAHMCTPRRHAPRSVDGRESE